MTRKLITAVGLFVAALTWVGFLSVLFDRQATVTKPAEDGSQAIIKFLDESAFRRDNSGEISLRMDILNPQGTPLLGLFKEMVRVTEHGQPATVKDFRGPGTQPVNVVLVIDISGSMSSGGKMAGAISAALVAIDELTVDRDRIGVIAFDNTFDVVQPLERLTQQVKQRCQQNVNLLAPRGSTVIGIPTQVGLQMFEQDNIDGPKILMVMTDGEDSTLPLLVDNIVEQSEKTGVPVFTIGFGNIGNPQAESVLRDLSTRCNAEYYHAPNPEQLANIYRAQLQELTKEFTVVYHSPFPQPDGLPRHVAVEIASPAGTLLAQDSYEIGGIIDSGGRTQSSESETPTAVAGAVSAFVRLLLFWMMFVVLAAALVAPSFLKRSPSGSGPTGSLASASPSQQTGQPAVAPSARPGPRRPPPAPASKQAAPASTSNTPAAAKSPTSGPVQPTGRSEVKSKAPPPPPAKPAVRPQRQQPADFKASEKKRIRPLQPPPPPPGSNS